MTQRSFRIEAIWDDTEKVWYSESDIKGLHLEAASIEEFMSLIDEFASDLIVTNHLSKDDLTGKALRDLIPAVVVSTRNGPQQAA